MKFIKSSFEKSTKENMRGGDGVVKFNGIVCGENLPPHSRLISEIILEPGCSIGVHEHESECELFYILEGVATVTDNGEEYELGVGEAHMCYSKDSHGIRNDTKELVRFLAVIITENA